MCMHDDERTVTLSESESECIAYKYLSIDT